MLGYLHQILVLVHYKPQTLFSFFLFFFFFFLFLFKSFFSGGGRKNKGVTVDETGQGECRADDTYAYVGGLC